MMWAALAIHVTDEALTGFLSVYNPTVLALRAKLGYWPMPTFEYREWLTDLTAFRNSAWFRPFFYFVAIVAGLLNATGHTIGTILGHTVYTVRFPRPAPGFYSSPLLILVSIYALLQLRRSRLLPGRSRLSQRP
jgi:hypothetical protein